MRFLFRVVAVFLFATAVAEDSPPRRSLDLETRGLLEQDLAVSFDKLERNDTAVAHYRLATARDPLLKAPWVNLAVHALEDDHPEQAVHLASVALSIDPEYTTARRVLDEALARLPSERERRERASVTCPVSDAAAASPDLIKAARECLESRAGWLAGLGSEQGGPLVELGRLELEAGNPESATVMLLLAQKVGGGDAALLSQAFSLSGDPCRAAEVEGHRPGSTYDGECSALRERRRKAETYLGAEFDDLAPTVRESEERRIESLLSRGLDPESAARRWRMERARGERPLLDEGALCLRLGEEWSEQKDPGESAVRIWRRRPGDSALAVFVVRTGSSTPDAILRRLLAPRRPGVLQWSPASLASTDPARSRLSRLAIEADTGGRLLGELWTAESPSAPGLMLVIGAFPGSGGLGQEAIDQVRWEILEGIQGAVLMPVRWPEIADLAPTEEFPVPLLGQDPGDERQSPWRTLPAGKFTVALPPGTVVALPSGAPRLCAPDRPSAILWFRGRFIDRDGVSVQIGDDRRAGSVDDLPVNDPSTSRGYLLGRNGQPPPPPLADPGASAISWLDVSRKIGPATGASMVSLSRFRPSTPGAEWIVARLDFDSRIVEIDIPAAAGARSIALYWIASTVRTVGGPPPPPPVDLSGRLGVGSSRVDLQACKLEYSIVSPK